MPTPHQTHPIVVTKRPRSEWRIPRIDAASRLYAQQQEEARIKELVKGTTPESREILRRILYGIEKRLRERTHTLEQIINDVDADFKMFEIIQPEFAILLSRMWGGSEVVLRESPPRKLATMVVLLTAAARKATVLKTTGG